MIRVVITQPDADSAPHIHEVRLHKGNARHFFASFVLTELRNGQTLRVSMFSARDGSSPPGVHWFRAFAAEYFPHGENVMWVDAAGRQSTYRFNPSYLEQVAVAVCAGVSR